jgi:mRNA interferase RelE/StbE
LTWKVEFVRSAEKEIAALDREAAKRIIRFLKTRVAKAEHPRMLGEALRGPELGRFWKYRVGAYRVIARIDDGALTVLVVRIGHRRQVYR